MRSLRIAVAAVAWLCVAAPPAAAAKPLVSTTVGTKPLGTRIPPSFLGYSIELLDLKGMLGNGDARGPNRPLVTFFRELRRVSGGAPVLRIGGGTQDNAWYNPAGAKGPDDLSVNVDVPMLAGVRKFVEATGSKVIFGLNLVHGDPRVPVELAKAALAIIGPDRILAFELGNEPDFYPRRPIAPGSKTMTGPARPAGYNPKQHRVEFARVRRLMAAAGIRTPLAGPGAQDPHWKRTFPTFVKTQRPQLGILTTHEYPLTACPGVGGFVPHAGILLEDGVTTAAARRMQPLVRIANRAGIEARLTETNSVSCGGLDQVSNVFASALWSVDWAFSMAFVGVDGINFHASPAFYRPFTAGFFDGAWRLSPAPAMYGNLAFAEAAPAGSRFLPAATFTQRVRGKANIRTWATVARDRRTVRVLVNYKAGTRSGDAIVSVPGSRARATLQRLDAPSWSSDFAGVRWAGRHLPVLSPDGRLRGPHVAQRLRKRTDRTFRFGMRPFTAALLTVRLERPVKAQRSLRATARRR